MLIRDENNIYGYRVDYRFRITNNFPYETGVDCYFNEDEIYLVAKYVNIVFRNAKSLYFTDSTKERDICSETLSCRPENFIINYNEHRKKHG